MNISYNESREIFNTLGITRTIVKEERQRKREREETPLRAQSRDAMSAASIADPLAGSALTARKETILNSDSVICFAIFFKNLSKTL